MKGKLFPIAGIALLSLAFTSAQAQQYQTIPLNGFNADVIANGVGSSAASTNSDVDGVNYAFVSKDFQLTASSTALTYGLPTNGLINSAAASPAGLSYQLASYSGNNSLRLLNVGDNGTLTFTTPKAAVNLYMLASSGSGASKVDVVVNFSDTTTQTFSAIDISDWYGGSNFAIQGIGRIKKTTDGLEADASNPRLYQIPLAISAANQSKTIQSVKVTKAGPQPQTSTSVGNIPNIFAFSADVYNSCPMPTNLASTTTMTGATINWTAPSSAPASGYQYYMSTSATAPTATTTPTGSTAAGVTSATVGSLTTGQTYYFWVRSNCGSTQSYWTMTQFTPGQMTTTYTAGDINTLYATSSSITPTSTTTCPGTLTVSVPAGYKIKSTDVSYTITALSNGWKSDQRSILACTTNNTTETSISSGVGTGTGSYSYNRTGLTLANNLTGNVTFELRAWRAYEGTGCNADYNKVDNNTFKITVTLEPLQLATSEVKASARERIAYPNPFVDAVTIEKANDVKTATITDLSGITVRTIEKPASTLHLGDLKTGVYILTLTMKDGAVKSSKMIKK
ncbi:T9SS type A sorting domain-containing protein [uncultured Chryseobacterium sp.]|uniref:T9SS type A sorting domain-containing protein n=1 Tax=uncultured Chryseobacterium sp. TaxID=259322 RepID=UPI0025F17082|nr:T9SS type A sorting domain-containing protein [uncultured Chryseobacterium sp.]